MTPITLPPFAAALEKQSVRHVTPCGDGDLVWRRWGAGEPVIMVHGGSGSWTHWIRIIERLQSRYEIWCPDLPGLGASAMPAPPLVPASCATALAQGIGLLIPCERRPQLVAFSWGAHVSTLAAVRLGDHIRSFTVTGCSALGLRGRDMPGLPKERSNMTAEERLGVHRRTLEMLMFKNADRIDQDAVLLQAANVAQARFRSREFALTDEVRRELANVTVPLQAIWGSHDAVAKPDLATVFATLKAAQPALQPRTIDNAGHWVMYEQADAYAATLVEELDRV